MLCALPFPRYTLQAETHYCSGAPFAAALQVSQLLFLCSQVQKTPTQTFQCCHFRKQLHNNNKWFLKEGKRSHSFQVFTQVKLSTISLLMLEEELGVPVAPLAPALELVVCWLDLEENRAVVGKGSC